jgi:hypothetical protein
MLLCCLVLCFQIIFRYTTEESDLSKNHLKLHPFGNGKCDLLPCLHMSLNDQQMILNVVVDVPAEEKQLKYTYIYTSYFNP